MRVLFLEPFHTGSHAAFLRVLVDGLHDGFGIEPTVLTMPGRHWKWRMRGSVSFFAQEHDAELQRDYDVVFASSFLPLAELIGLYPHLGAARRILYFHENQLAYPVREEFAGPRDHHFGFTQMVSAVAATRCVFNSDHNRQTFLDAGAELLRQMPDCRLPSWRKTVEARSDVLGVPLELPEWRGEIVGDQDERSAGPILLFNHRWEHDKDPTAFCTALDELQADGVPFRVAVCGESSDVAKDAIAARRRLGDRVVHWGPIAARADYLGLLRRAHVAVSTAVHEFFGVAVLEATYLGARPLVPDRLAYRETLPERYRYSELVPELRRLCEQWSAGAIELRADRREIVMPFSVDRLLPRYYALFEGTGRPVP